MEYVNPIHGVYEHTLITLVRNMKLSEAHQKVNECTTTLLELGYSKQELVESIKAFLKEE